MPTNLTTPDQWIPMEISEFPHQVETMTHIAGRRQLMPYMIATTSNVFSLTVCDKFCRICAVMVFVSLQSVGESGLGQLTTRHFLLPTSPREKCKQRC